MANNLKAVLANITGVLAYEWTVNELQGSPVFGLRAFDQAGHHIAMVFRKNNEFILSDSDGSKITETVVLVTGDRIGLEYDKASGTYLVTRKTAGQAQEAIASGQLNTPFEGEVLFNHGLFSAFGFGQDKVTLDAITDPAGMLISYSAGAENHAGAAL